MQICFFVDEKREISIYKNMFYALNVTAHNSIFDIFIEFCVCSFLHIYN